MIQAYEMIYILRPDLNEEQVQQEVTKYREFLSQYSLENLEIKIWGKRRLAYPIKKFQDGIYVQMNYQADGKHVAPLERAMRLSDEVIRYLNLKLPKVSATPPEEEIEIEAVEPDAVLA